MTPMVLSENVPRESARLDEFIVVRMKGKSIASVNVHQLVQVEVREGGKVKTTKKSREGRSLHVLGGILTKDADTQ